MEGRGNWLWMWIVVWIAMGYVMFKIGKPQCIVSFVEGERSDKTRRPNNQRSRQRRN